MMIFGFLTFGGTCQGFLLNNYAAQDNLAFLSRFTVLASVVFCYPMTLAVCRDDFLEVVCPKATAFQRDVAGVGILAFSTLVSAICDDLGFVVALTGGVFAVTMTY